MTSLSESEREGRIEESARDEFGRTFDLSDELPLRIVLIRTGTEEFVLLLVVHHICWDDDSWAVFFNELGAAYAGHLPDGAAPQFVAVEVLDTSAEPSMADVAYWAETLRPAPEPLELPARGLHTRRGAPNGEPGRCPPVCSAGSRSSPASDPRRRSWCCSAAFAVLVRRYTGAPDFLVSVPVTERGAAAENAIGYFGNTLLLRIRRDRTTPSPRSSTRCVRPASTASPISPSASIASCGK